ncbi:MAG: hypothetical protein FWE68_01130 [Defluviitaleaceae bacterium]|nr:hypothetical protein [Defluviitaleaceae bacterium]
MNNELLKTIEKKVNTLIDAGALNGKYAVIFGVNHPGDFIIRRLRDRGVYTSVVIDNNPANHGILFEGVPVTSPEDALSPFNENAAVLICSRYYPEMRRQLENMGYKSDAHIFKILDMGTEADFSLDEELFGKKAESAVRGAVLADKILKEHNAERLLICPVKAHGDVYMACAFLREYLAKSAGGAYVLAVIGKSCADVAELFGVKNIYNATQEEIDALTAAYRMLSDESVLHITQPFWNYSGFISRLDCYKGLNYQDYYKYWVFGLDEAAAPDVPAAECNEGYIRELFRENNLQKGKTVILSPYANSMPGIPSELFEKLAERLKSKGYSVATNAAGDEKPVPGTVSLGFPVKELIPVAEYAGAFAGLRSGLFDVLISASCKKVILYPQKAAAHGTVSELYSVNHFDEGVPAFELIYEGNPQKAVDAIEEALGYDDRLC